MNFITTEYFLNTYIMKYKYLKNTDIHDGDIDIHNLGASNIRHIINYSELEKSARFHKRVGKLSPLATENMVIFIYKDINKNVINRSSLNIN